MYFSSEINTASLHLRHLYRPITVLPDLLELLKSCFVQTDLVTNLAGANRGKTDEYADQKNIVRPLLSLLKYTAHLHICTYAHDDLQIYKLMFLV